MKKGGENRGGTGVLKGHGQENSKKGKARWCFMAWGVMLDLWNKI